MKFKLLKFKLIFFILILLSGIIGMAKNPVINGVLRVDSTNPRYFTDNSGSAIYLTGSHTWTNFQSWGSAIPGYPAAVDFNVYLNFLSSKHHNVIRLWVTDTSWRDSFPAGSCEPQPFVRTGPGTALRGGLKFNLNRLNQVYFDKLSQEVSLANDRGIYVIVMLFDVWGVNGYGTRSGTWSGSPFNKDNNINGINGDPNGDEIGLETYRLVVPSVTTVQEAYVRKVIDTVNGFDNVLYEIINEGDDSTKDWQYHFIDYIKSYEAGKPKQHPVGVNTMSLAYQTGSKADFISPLGLGDSAPYAINPPASDGTKVVIADTDHIEYPRESDDPLLPGIWVWKSFLRGLNTLLMDAASELTGEKQHPGTENARLSMGYTLTYANKMNLNSAIPHDELSSTTYCLADPGREYLVCQPGSGKLSLSLQKGTYHYEWFNPQIGIVVSTGTISVSSGSRTFSPPFSGCAILYLKTDQISRIDGKD